MLTDYLDHELLTAISKPNTTFSYAINDATIGHRLSGTRHTAISQSAVGIILKRELHWLDSEASPATLRTLARDVLSDCEIAVTELAASTKTHATRVMSYTSPFYMLTVFVDRHDDVYDLEHTISAAEGVTLHNQLLERFTEATDAVPYVAVKH